MFSKVGLRTKILLANLSLLLFSFLFIGIFTYLNFNKQNDTYHRKRLKRKELSLVKQVEYHLAKISQFVNQKNFVLHFENHTKELTDINNIDVNYYNLKGEVIIQSDPEIFTEKRLPKKLPTKILKQVLEKNDYTLEHSEGVRFFSSYFLIKNKKGENIAILNIPYFDFDKTKSNDIETYLGELSIIYLFLLILAVVMVYILAKYITEPLRTLSEDIKKMELDKDAPPLEWNVNDEVGLLIKEYNKTREKLKASAELLAQKQKEEAWKEMAKQVAHEVKNPLTPMKLQVQFLQKNLDPTDENFKEELDEFCLSMVEQIDNMTNIANAFSDFASLPKLAIEKIEIHNILHPVAKLYQSQNLDFTTYKQEICVMADKNQLHQVFINLIKNAYQSIPNNKEPKVVMSYESVNDFLYIYIKDNGSGIPTRIQSKIFEPKFTTKNSGKGLGLAMVKNIILAHGGKIKFQTQENIGTTFIIKLPIEK
ncbi:MAG: ATP-binding protein [Flavobacteriales bacterium]|jgi:signal transduction histidine kinase|nr:ATP-binding protein [Flavobacteriales bacterium]